MKTQFRLALNADDLTECRRLRWGVFVVEQGLPDALEHDPLDAASTHVMAEKDGALVGVARFERQGDTVKIGRVCVTWEARGQGVGTDLITQACARSGASKAVIAAHPEMIPFYQHLGFEPSGPPMMADGIPHISMAKSLL